MSRYLLLESFNSSRVLQTAYVSFKLRISESQNRKWADKTAQKILLDKKLRETTNLCVEIMNSRRQAEGKLGRVLQIRVCVLT